MPEEEVKVEEIKAPELTEEEKKKEAQQKRVELLRDVVEKMVVGLFQNENDFTMWELGYATDLFKDWMTIKAHSSVQYDECLKASDAANEKYYTILGKDLVKLTPPDVQPTEKPSEDVSA